MYFNSRHTALFLLGLCLVQATFALNSCSPLSLLYRTMDGSCNNILFSEWGKTHTFFRTADGGLEAYPWAHVPKIDPMPKYSELDTLPSDGPRGNARNISHLLCLREDLEEIDPINHSMFSVMFGQFVNHDLENNQFVESEDANGFSALVTYVKDVNDVVCTQNGTNYCLDPADNEIISSFARNSGGVFQSDGTFKTINNATSYLDLDLVYGRSESDNDKLRAHNGGKLLMISNQITIPNIGTFGPFDNVLPSYDLTGMPINNGLRDLLPKTAFTAGDQRINENIALSFFHTLFAREHNLVCEELMEENLLWKLFPTVFDEVIFQKARSIVIAKYQNIVYEQYIPTVYGSHFNSLLGSYKSYNPLLDPSTSLPFASAAFRYGHFTIRDYIVMDECGTAYFLGNPAPPQLPTPSLKIGLGMTGPAPFVSPMGVLARAGGFENIIRGLINERAAPNTPPVDPNIHTFLPQNNFVLDLISLDIMRARFNHLPNYQRIRKAFHGVNTVTDNIYGLPGCPAELEGSNDDDPIECYVHITGDEDTAAELRSVYRKVNLIDAIIGMTVEEKVSGSSFSRTSGNIIIDQFKRSRDADRFFYKNILNQFSSSERSEILNTNMKSVLTRNFDVDSDVPENPFMTPENYRNNLIASCE